MASSLQIQWFFSLFVLIAILANQATSRSLHKSRRTMLERHQEWMIEHERAYENAEEHRRRYKIFKSNIRMIESFNAAGDKPFNVSVNKFADLTHEEFKKLYLARETSDLPGSTNANVKIFTPDDMIYNYPERVDWRDVGAVTSVKDQGQCASCWTFSALAAMESSHILNGGGYYDLSEQQLIDCDPSPVDHGCNTGFMRSAYDYIGNNGGVTTEANYPYRERQQYCDRVKESQPAVKLQNYGIVAPYSEAALMSAVFTKPVSVGLDAENRSFQFYHKGIISGRYCRNDVMNHAALLIGYDTDEYGRKFWLVKNSWGVKWGEDGFVRIARDDNVGICGIARYATVPYTS